MNLNVDIKTYYKRRSRGYTHEEACICPPHMPLWMLRIEQREGRSVRYMLTEGAAAAWVTGYSLSDYAREWGVKPATLLHWSRKWGIKWDASESYNRREAARQTMKRLNERRAGRRADPNSIRSRLKAADIPRRSYYSVREELRDAGVEHTEQDIIEICKARRRA